MNASCSNFYLRYYKNITNFLFLVLWQCLPTERATPTCRNIDIYMHAISIPNFFFNNIVKIFQTCHFEHFSNASPCRKLWCLYAFKNSTSSLTSFLKYCKDIPNLQFLKLWECLTISIKIHSIGLLETFTLSPWKKSASPLTYFWRHYKEIANLLFWIIWAWLSTHT